jgi:hypothetical protein
MIDYESIKFTDLTEDEDTPQWANPRVCKVGAPAAGKICGTGNPANFSIRLHWDCGKCNSCGDMVIWYNFECEEFSSCFSNFTIIRQDFEALVLKNELKFLDTLKYYSNKSRNDLWIGYQNVLSKIRNSSEYKQQDDDDDDDDNCPF